MEPTHPNFSVLPIQREDRAHNVWRFGLLLPLAAAIPLLVTVIRHRPEAKPVVVPEAEVSAYETVSLPPLEKEAVSVVTEEEPAGPDEVIVPALRPEPSAQTGGQGPGRGMRLSPMWSFPGKL